MAAVQTWSEEAPIKRKSSASSHVWIPPIAETGSWNSSAFPSRVTMWSAIGLTAGPQYPPDVPWPATEGMGLNVSWSTAITLLIVLMSETPSAPPRCAAIAAVYSLVAPRYWEASQGLVVRQDTAGSAGPRPGKFADLYEMRTLQETILELAKSQHVVSATLSEVNKRLAPGASPPTPSDIEKFRKRLKMVPPDGSEFGKTEVFYFCVEDTSRQRAIELVGELCGQLDLGLRDLRVKVPSMEPFQAAVLGAMEITDELFRLRERLDELEGEFAARVTDLADAMREAMDAADTRRGSRKGENAAR